MSDKELIEGTQLDEFKASMGDPSEVPDSINTDAKAPGDSKKAVDDPKDSPTAVKVPGTKAGMINAMMNKMNEMQPKDLKAAYGKMNASMNPAVKEEVETTEDLETVSIRELPTVTSDDIDISEDVAAMFAGDDLSEEFKEKVTTVFEASIVSKVNEQLSKISANFESELAEEVEALQEELTDKLDSYTDYVVEQWMDDNKLAVEQGLKAEMVENFMVGLKGLFEEHYVNIPDEKVDVVEELASKTEELEARLNEEIERNVQMKQVVEGHTKSSLIESVSVDLTETQKAKFKSLAEGIDFKDEDGFVGKINTIKESYFGQVEESAVSYEFDEAEPLEEEVKTVSGPMAGYMDAISRSIKK